MVGKDHDNPTSGSWLNMVEIFPGGLPLTRVGEAIGVSGLPCRAGKTATLFGAEALEVSIPE